MKGFSKIEKLDKDEYYYSDEKYIIFTEKYHLKRGYCCNNNHYLDLWVCYLELWEINLIL